MKKGRLIVIEGIDGSGKTTQVGFLKQALALQGVPLEAISFPRYEDNIYGKLIKKYLQGDFGSIKEANPYLVALAFAGDRALAKPLIEKWLSEGKAVLVNRYVSSSKAHLGANLPKENREEFFKWLDELEYQTNGIPKADLTILLSTEPKIAQKNVLSDSPDIHEDNLMHLEQTHKIYLELAEIDKTWQIINCMDDNQMRLPQDIHKELISLI